MRNFSRREIGIVVALLTALLLIAFYDVAFLGKTFKITTSSSQALFNGVYGQSNNKPKFIPVNGTDAPILEEPTHEFIRRNLRRGILPLWNPHQACGMPLIGMLEIGLFFPLHFILYLLPSFYAWDVLIFVRFLCAGLFTYLFMRSLRFTRIPSLGAAICFMLSGPMILLQYWTANVDILTPLLFLVLERLIHRPNKKNTAFVAIVVGLTFFAGHPEHIFLVNFYGFVYFCFRLFALRKYTIPFQAIKSLTLAYILGIGLSSIVLWPFLYNFTTEFWHGHPSGVGLLNEEIRERILTLAVPHFFQRESLTFDFTFAGWWGGYLGTLPLALAFLSLFNNHRRGLNYFIFIFGFLLVSKAYAFFYINWIGYLPLFNLCRYAIHTPHLIALSVAICAGMGLRTILSSRNIFPKALIFSIGLGLLMMDHLIHYRNAAFANLALYASVFTFGILIIFQIILWLKDKRRITPRLVSTLLILLLTTELFLYIHRERPHRFDSFGNVPYIQLIKNSSERVRVYGLLGTFYPNTASGFEVDDLGIFFSLLPKRFVEFVSGVINPNIFKSDLRPPALRSIPLTQPDNKYFLDLLNVRYIATPTEDTLKRIFTNFEAMRLAWNNPMYSEEVNLYVRPTAFPRAFIVHKAILSQDPESTLKIMKLYQTELRNLVVIEQRVPTEIKEALRQAPVQDNSTAHIVSYSPNEVVIQANLENAGFLVLGDGYHPDWKVFVDGKKSELYKADYLLRAVALPAGQHEVKFVFIPMSFYYGAIVSAVCLLLILWLCLYL